MKSITKTKEQRRLSMLSSSDIVQSIALTWNAVSEFRRKNQAVPRCNAQNVIITSAGFALVMRKVWSIIKKDLTAASKNLTYSRSILLGISSQSISMRVKIISTSNFAQNAQLAKLLMRKRQEQTCLNVLNATNSSATFVTKLLLVLSTIKEEAFVTKSQILGQISERRKHSIGKE